MSEHGISTDPEKVRVIRSGLNHNLTLRLVVFMV